MDVYKGNIAVHAIVCTPLLQADGLYGCRQSEAWSVSEIQKIPAVGLSDLDVVKIVGDSGTSTFVAAASRKSHASISSYDQSTYNVPSFIYEWDHAKSQFRVMQVCACIRQCLKP